MQARQNRAIDLFCGDVTLTQSMVDAYYEEQFVGPDREDYADDPEKYKEEILANDNESFYKPEGYRYIRQIVLQYPEEAISACRSQQVEMNRAAQSLTRALQKLTLAATEFDGSTDAISEAKAAYDIAAEQMTDAQNQYMDALRVATEPLDRDTLDEIMERFDAGIDFGSLIDKYSADRTDKNLNGDGYPFHPDSPNWPEPFVAAASALEKPGDISDAVYTEQGVHILYYYDETLHCQSFQWNQDKSKVEYSYDSLGKPHITFARFYLKDDGPYQWKHHEMYREIGRIAYPDDPTPVGTTAVGFNFDLNRSGFLMYPDKSVKSGMGDGYEFVKTCSLLDMEVNGRVKPERRVMSICTAPALWA